MAEKKGVGKIKPKKVKGRITSLKVLPYKGCMVYIRRINIEIFEYLVVIRNEIWSSYWIVKPAKGKKKLTKDEVNQAAALAMAGACATVDMQLGEELDEKTKETVEIFEGLREKVEDAESI